MLEFYSFLELLIFLATTPTYHTLRVSVGFFMKSLMPTEELWLISLNSRRK
jgi:hypothetical protein